MYNVVTLIIWTSFVTCSCFRKILFGSSIWPPGFTPTYGAQVLLPFEQNRQTKILRCSELHVTFSNLPWADNVICKIYEIRKIQTSEPHCVYTDSIPEVWFDFPTGKSLSIATTRGHCCAGWLVLCFINPTPSKGKRCLSFNGRSYQNYPAQKRAIYLWLTRNMSHMMSTVMHKQSSETEQQLRESDSPHMISSKVGKLWMGMYFIYLL